MIRVKMRILNNIVKSFNNHTVFIDSNLLYLDTEYIDIYDMNYIDRNLLEDDNIIIEIKEKFIPYNMILYYGSKSDLNCKQARILYKSMIDYFINLFLYKIHSITNIDINNIIDINDIYLCRISECTSIIRASIKKYIRYRTNKNALRCSKETLDKRNSKDYNCSYPISNLEYCPSFSYLRKDKSCKNIIVSTKKSNPFYTLGSKVYFTKYKNNKSRNHIVKPNKYNTLHIIRNPKNKTRKVKII